MSSSQHRTSLQCPNCGGTMTVDYIGDLQDKQVTCQFCHTAFDVPDNFERVRKVKRTQKGFFRKREVVEEVIHERRSDYAPPPPPQPQFQQQQGRPIVIHVPGFNLGPGARQAQQASSGSCIGSLIVLIFVGVLCVGIGAVVAASLGIKEVDKVFDDLGLDEITSNLGIDSVEEREPVRVIGGHEFQVRNVVFSPDGTRFITSDLHNSLRLWDAETFALIKEYEDSITGYSQVKFVGDGSTFMGVNSSGHIFEWDSASGGLLRNNTFGRIHTAILRDDGQQYAALTYDNWGLSVREFPGGTQIASGAVGEYVSGGAFSPSGEYLVLVATGGELHIFDTQTWRLIYQDDSIASDAETLEFIPDTNTFIVAGSEDIEIYEIFNGTVSAPETWTVGDDLTSSELLSIDSVAISSDGKYVAIGNFFDNVYIWDFEERKLLIKLITENAPQTVDFSGDGSRVIAGSTFEGRALIWDISDIGD